MFRRLALLAGVLASTGGKAAAQRSLPLYMAIGTVAAVIFEGNGMKPSRLTDLASESPLFRCGLWGVWLLFGMPASRALLRAPGTVFLRALPVPRWQHLTLLAVFMIAVELPWLLLWTRSAGPLAGCAACIAAIAAHGLIVARPQRAEEIAATATLGAAISLGAPTPLLLMGAVPALFIGLRAAWLRAPESEAGHPLSLVRGPAPIALALSYGMALFRGHQAVLIRSLVLTALGVLISAAWARATIALEVDAIARLSIVVFTPVTLLVGAGFAGPVLHHEQRTRWILDACGTPALVRRLAAAGATAAPCVACGALHGAALGAVSRAGPTGTLRLAGSAALTGLLLAPLVLAWVRWAERQNGGDSGRVLLIVLGALPLTTALARSLGELSLLVWTASLALVAVAVAAERLRARRAGRPAQSRWGGVE